MSTNKMSISLFEACKKGDKTRVKSLIAAKYPVNQADEHGRTALHYCAHHKTTDCADVLLRDASAKANILNQQDHDGYSVLHLACINGNEAMVKYLCEQGASMEVRDNQSRTVVHWITIYGHLHLFDILLDYKAPIHTPDVHGAFPIHYAAQLSGISEKKDLRIDSEKSSAILQKIIFCKLDLDCIDGKQRTPLMWAACAGATDQLRLLYKHGADQLHVDKDSRTALHHAAHFGHLGCIQMLAQHCRCPLEREDANGQTALFYSVMYNHSDTCKLLLELKANPNHRDKRSRTPSHIALWKGSVDCLQWLAKYNANMWLKNKQGDYPIHETIKLLSNIQQHERSEIYAAIRYIFQACPNKINIQNDQHRTPLHLAVSYNDVNTCDVLIECGASVNSFIKNLSGDFITPYDLAHQYNHKECANHLLHKYGGQKGHILANIFARRIQKSFRQYRSRKEISIVLSEDSNSPQKNESFDEMANASFVSSKPSITTMRKQSQSSLDTRNVVNNPKTHSVRSHSLVGNSLTANENEVEERRRHFAKSKTIIESINQTEESKVDPSNKIIIQTSTSISTYNKLYDRRKIVAEELHKLRQARIQNHYIVINRSLYKILIENGFSPHNQRVEDIEKYLESLIKTYDTELESIRQRTKNVPPKQNRRTSLMY